MAFRFRKSIKIIPGIRVNLGKKGASLSVGGRGASVTIGKQGKYANVGIPGTGISFRERIDKQSEQKRLQREEKKLLSEYKKLEQEELRKEALKNITLKLNDNGSINILNSFNEPLSRKDMKLLWKQHSQKIKNWLESQKNEINGDVDLLENIYQDTVEPNNIIEYIKKPFTKEEPKKPTFEDKPVYQPLSSLGFFAKFSKKKKKDYTQKVKEHEKQYKDDLNSWEDNKKQKLETYKKELLKWEEQKKLHNKKEEGYLDNFDELIKNDINFMELMVDNTLNSISWPRETLISYHINNNYKKILIDVDLPEIEDIPQKIASISSTEKKLNIKNKPKTKLQLEYAKHIHGIAFRIAGYIFATLPNIETITISGYSQRLDKAIGKINDDYLYSFKITKDGFSEINFNALENVDPIKALDIFEHRKKMTSTGIFKVIKPFEE